jgi:hypothetical protein
MKQVFGRSSILNESWFNAIQNLKFVANPVDDGEYPLLCECNLDLPSIDAKLITVGTEQELNIDQLLDCEVISGNQPDSAISSEVMRSAVLGANRTALSAGKGIQVSPEGTVGLVPASLLTDQLILGNGLTIFFGEILANGRGGGNIYYNIKFPRPFLSRPSILRLDQKYVNNVADRYRVIDAQLQVYALALNKDSIKIGSYWDKGGGGSPNEFSVYYAVMGFTA